MADEAPESGPSTALVAARPQRMAVVADIPIFDTARFEHQGRIATVIARSGLLPDTMKGDNFEQAQANAFLVVSMAERWALEPTQVAQGCSIVYGKLMLEGKLVAAILESKLGVELKHYYKGERGKDDRRIYVTDVEITEEELAALKPGDYPFRLQQRMVDGSIAEWRTKTKGGGVNDAWVAPQQADMMLRYRGDRVWTRAYRSALLLGVYTPDEMANLREDRDSLREDIETGRRQLTSGFGDDAQGRPPAASKPAPDDHSAGGGEAPGASAEAEERHDPETGEVIEGDRPIKTADAPVAEAGPASSASATGASGDTAAETSSPAASEQASGAGEKAPPKKPAAAKKPPAEKPAEEKKPDEPKPEEPKPEETVQAEPPAAEEAGSEPDDTQPPPSFYDTPPFHKAVDDVDSAGHWLGIKQALRTLQSDPIWKEASNEDAARIRGHGFARFKRLADQGDEKTPIASDPFLFRLWMNHGATSRKEIAGLFPTLMRSPDWLKLTDGMKNDFGQEMERVCKALDEADG